MTLHPKEEAAVADAVLDAVCVAIWPMFDRWNCFPWEEAKKNVEKDTPTGLDARRCLQVANSAISALSILDAQSPPVPDAVIERAKEAAVEKYVAFDCDLSREAFIEGAKFSANLLATPLDREAVARAILMSRKNLNEIAAKAWMETYTENSQGLDELRIAVFLAYRDADAIIALPAADANTPAPTKQCTCGAGGVKHNVDAPYRCQCDLDAPASPASDGKVEGEKS